MRRVVTIREAAVRVLLLRNTNVLYPQRLNVLVGACGVLVHELVRDGRADRLIERPIRAGAGLDESRYVTARLATAAMSTNSTRTFVSRGRVRRLGSDSILIHLQLGLSVI